VLSVTTAISTPDLHLGMMGAMKKSSARLLTILLCGTLCSSAFAQEPPPPAEAPAMTQVRAGDALMQAGQYREAAMQYEAAYAIDPDIVILERLAEAYRMAGDGTRAAAIYQRIAQLRGQQAPPPPGPTYVAPSALPGAAPVYTYSRPRQRPGQQLLNSGIGLLVAGYALGLVGGGITMGATYATNGDYSWYGAGGMLMIPIAGPFATMIYNSNYWWAVPWAVIDGGMQLAGLALAIAGGAINASHKNHKATASSKGLPFSITPYQPDRTGAGLAFRMSF
jgi:hypothetical protein